MAPKKATAKATSTELRRSPRKAVPSAKNTEGVPPSKAKSPSPLKVAKPTPAVKPAAKKSATTTSQSPSKSTKKAPGKKIAASSSTTVEPAIGATTTRTGGTAKASSPAKAKSLSSTKQAPAQKAASASPPKKRGRPRKDSPSKDALATEVDTSPAKRGPGRPRKTPPVDEPVHHVDESTRSPTRGRGRPKVDTSAKPKIPASRRSPSKSPAPSSPRRKGNATKPHSPLNDIIQQLRVYDAGMPPDEMLREAFEMIRRYGINLRVEEEPGPPERIDLVDLFMQYTDEFDMLKPTTNKLSEAAMWRRIAKKREREELDSVDVRPSIEVPGLDLASTKGHHKRKGSESRSPSRNGSVAAQQPRGRRAGSVTAKGPSRSPSRSPERGRPINASNRKQKTLQVDTSNPLEDGPVLNPSPKRPKLREPQKSRSPSKSPTRKASLIADSILPNLGNGSGLNSRKGSADGSGKLRNQKSATGPIESQAAASGVTGGSSRRGSGAQRSPSVPPSGSRRPSGSGRGSRQPSPARPAHNRRGSRARSPPNNQEEPRVVRGNDLQLERSLRSIATNTEQRTVDVNGNLVRLPELRRKRGPPPGTRDPPAKRPRTGRQGSNDDGADDPGRRGSGQHPARPTGPHRPATHGPLQPRSNRNVDQRVNPGRGDIETITNPRTIFDANGRSTGKPNPFFESMPAPPVWYRRMPSVFPFGETPRMEQLMSDQITRDLAKGDDQSNVAQPVLPAATPAAQPATVRQRKSILGGIMDTVSGMNPFGSRTPQASIPEPEQRPQRPVTERPQRPVTERPQRPVTEAPQRPASQRAYKPPPPMWDLPTVSEAEIRAAQKALRLGRTPGNTDDNLFTMSGGLGSRDEDAIGAVH